MPFYQPFNLPFFYNNFKYNGNNFIRQRQFSKNNTSNTYNIHSQKKASENAEIPESSEAFFEIFGLKLYFDDILIMCILFFLYTEKVHDDELFICLILLLLT